LISEPEKTLRDPHLKNKQPKNKTCRGSGAELSLQILTIVPYKFLTIRTSPSFCERISSATRLGQNGAATLALKTTPLCLMKAPEAQFVR
jgi:hypothetical protein